MSIPPQPVLHSTTFLPKPLETVNIVGQYVNLNPVIALAMNTHEWAHAFHVNKTNLCNLTQMLTALGHQTGQSTTVEGKIGSNFLHHFMSAWSNFSQLDIISFHKLAYPSTVQPLPPTQPSFFLSSMYQSTNAGHLMYSLYMFGQVSATPTRSPSGKHLLH